MCSSDLILRPYAESRVRDGECNPLIQGTQRKSQIFPFGRKTGHGVHGIRHQVMDSLLKVVGVQKCGRDIIHGIYGNVKIGQFRGHTGENTVEQSLQVCIFQGQRRCLRAAVNDVQTMIEIFTAVIDMGQLFAVLLRNVQKTDFRLDGLQA